MTGFTLIDGIVAGVILISALLAYTRGFVRESMSILGWIFAAAVAFNMAPAAAPLVKEIPVISSFLVNSCELSMIASFAAVFAISLVVASVFTPLMSSVVSNSALSGLDHGIGFFFGVARGVLLVSVSLIVYDRVMVTDSIPMVDNSRSANIFARSQEELDKQIPSDAPGWIVSRYESLVSTCTSGSGLEV